MGERNSRRRGVPLGAQHNGVDPAEQHNAKAAEAALQDIHNCLRILDQALAGKQFLLDSFTLADSHLHSFTSWLRHMKVDFAPYANLEAWNGRCAARPAAVRAASSG